MARPIEWLAIGTKPFVRLLSVSTRALLRIHGVRESSGSAVTGEEIHAMLAEGTSAGLIEMHEHAMLRNVFRLSTSCPPVPGTRPVADAPHAAVRMATA